MATSFRNLFWNGLNNLGEWFDWIYRQVSWKLPRGKLFAPTECEGSKTATRPTSVNYHFTRQCNYQCGFCFHTAKSSYVLPIDEAMRGLRLLQEAGMEKINFSGGEPFIHQKGKYVGELVRFCKRQLKLDSVTIVSNGSLITEDWFIRYGEDLDILAISCDSFRPKTNELIGRRDRRPSRLEDDHSVGERHLQSLERVRSWCRDYKVAFKINTVVNALNFEEDMNRHIQQLNPVRWKVFQCLLVGGENQGEKALRDAQQLVVTDDQFEAFLQRHDQIGCLVPESNSQMRFLDCSAGQKIPSPSLLDVGVANAMERSGFDEQMFFKRGGKYVWSKSDMSSDLLDW